MSGIVNSGVARNLVNDVVGGTLVPNADERKFVTFLNQLGGVHTIIVDAEHAAKDADELLQWFEHTQAIAGTSASVPTDPNHVPPDDVIGRANARMGYGEPTDSEPAPANTSTFEERG
jgi:hypothetical protein